MSSNLNAVKVRLKISFYGNSRKDEVLTGETVQKHDLGKGAGAWVKKKLADETLKPLRKLAGVIRSEHYRLTLPWEEGERLLTLKAKPTYDATMVSLREQFDIAVAEFISAYPDAIAQARELHKETFNSADYPGADEMRAAFGVQVVCEPLPQSSHFIGTLTGDSLTAAVAAMESRNEERIADAVADAWERLIGPVKHLAEKLASPDAVFRDTLVENCRDIVSLIPSLNVTGDNSLAAAGAEVAALLDGISAELLRETPVVRKITADKAAAVLARFGAVGARKFAGDVAAAAAVPVAADVPEAATA